MKHLKGFALAGLVMSGAILATTAQAEVTGKSQYMNACATCHGESGKGDGYLAGFLSLTLPDLTTLSQRNDGAFPMLNVIHIIDGRSGVRGHGGEMPVWGDRFAIDMENPGPFGSEVAVRGRILSLAYYLESIQE